MKTTDVIIVGGGVIGCAIAYYLGRAQVDVLLLERAEIGGQASGAAAGLLAPLGPLAGPGPFADLVLAGFATLDALIPQLEEMTGISVGYERTGALRVVRNPKRISHLQKRMERWLPLGLQMDWLDGVEAREREPLLGPDICAAVYAPQESQIHAASLVRAFASAAQKMGVHIEQHQEVDRVLLDGTKVVGVSTKQGEIVTCKTLILASGAWTDACASRFQATLPIQPQYGQLIALPQTTPPLRHIIFGEAAYLVPRGERILVGATKEDRGFDVSVTEQGSSWLYETAGRLVPALSTSKVQAAWAGLRPKTPDSHPILGLLPGWDNIVVAAGHNSVGIILSALTGQCITELVTIGDISPFIKPFAAERFS
jgi:glycine oxidase